MISLQPEFFKERNRKSGEDKAGGWDDCVYKRFRQIGKIEKQHNDSVGQNGDKNFSGFACLPRLIRLHFGVALLDFLNIVF